MLIGFFLPLEITYEILYDLRDVNGDRALEVPTFPVVHGVAWSHRAIDLLLVLSAPSGAGIASPATTPTAPRTDSRRWRRPRCFAGCVTTRRAPRIT